VTRQHKIMFGEMRSAGVRQVLIYCSDYQCGHCNIVADDTDRWPDELRLSDIEPRFVCTTTAVTVRAMAEMMTGDEASVLLAPGEEMLLTLVRFDHVIRGVCETQRIKVTAIWRHASTRWVRPFPSVLHTSLKDIADRERAVVAAGRRA